MTSALLFAGSLLLAAGQPSAQQAEQYATFYEAAADLDTAGQISTWEAFLAKYPRSPYAAKARAHLAELKGEKPAPAPTPVAAPTPAPKPAPARGASKKPAAAPADYDPDLAFLYEEGPSVATPAAVSAPVEIATPAPTPTPAPAPRPVAKPRPAPTPEASFFDAPATDAEAGTAQASVWDSPAPTSSSSGSVWQDAPAAAAPQKETKSRSTELALASPKSTRASAAARARRQPRPVMPREWHETEIAAFHSLSFGEEYVNNSLSGLAVSRRFGDRISLALEGAAASSQETDTLRTLRAQGRPPAVITKFNYAAGGGVQIGTLAPGGRNDLFVLAGGGIVNADVEICKETAEGTPCAAPLFFKNVTFNYATAGVGHRFFVTSRIALHTELRGRYVFEKVDEETEARGSFQIHVGPSVSF